MAAGKRNRKIVIERHQKVGENDFGEDILDWTTYAEPFAEVLFGTGSERREAAQESGSAPATFRVLHTALTAAVKVTDRIVFDGSNWDIISSVPSIRLNRMREITAVRSAA